MGTRGYADINLENNKFKNITKLKVLNDHDSWILPV